jgi:CheY-like chemotaxis protein
MPGMSGLELPEHIKNKFIKPPPIVMMMTAYVDKENFETAMRP